MFFVYNFNYALEDFEVIGAFSKEDEARAFAEASKTDRFTPVVVHSTFKEVMDEAMKMRLGAMAKTIDRLMEGLEAPASPRAPVGLRPLLDGRPGPIGTMVAVIERGKLTIPTYRG